MKHQHAIRLIYNSRPLEALGIYESDNQYLTIEDFKKINDKRDDYQMIMSLYIGYMSKSEACDKLTAMSIKIAPW